MDKFSEKYIKNSDILKKAIIGYEFEFYTDEPYYKLMELLNEYLNPIKVSGFRKYHSSFTPTKNHFKFEPDLSLGWQGVELITGPMSYYDSRIILLKVLNFMKKYTNTDEKCSLHINISFDKEKTSNTLEKISALKIILNIDEELIYKFFPERRDNFYAKSVKNLIPFKDYDYASDAVNLLSNNLELPDTKYYGINLKNFYNGRLEFRYIGGDDYHTKSSEILELLDYFVLLTYNSIVEPMDEDDNEELKKILNKNISQFKKFAKLDDFIAEFPTVKIQIDKSDNYTDLKTYYDKIYNELYEIINNIYNLNDCIINYDTDEQRIEIVDASFKVIFDINNITIVDSDVNNGTFNHCIFADCNITSSHLQNCKIQDSNVFNCKIESSHIDANSVVNDSFIYNSFIDGEIGSGVIRSCKIGEYAKIGDEVKIVTDSKNYFGDDKDLSQEDKMKTLRDFKNTNQQKNKYLSSFGGDNKKQEF